MADESQETRPGLTASASSSWRKAKCAEDAGPSGSPKMAAAEIHRENRMGGFWKGGFSNNRFVLKPDVAIASEVSILSNSLAITDFQAKIAQHVQLFENPLPGTPPFAIPKSNTVHFILSLGIIERGVPHACVCACASSATLCSVHVLRVFLCIFSIEKGI